MEYSTLYRSKEGRNIIHNLYRKHAMALNLPVLDETIMTSYGETHIMRYGNPTARPLFAFYGELLINPLVMRPILQGLDLDKIQLIVPDPLGAIGFSDDIELSLKKNEHQQWATQVMDLLKLQEIDLLGYSFGATLAMRLALTAQGRVQRLILFNPSGFTSVESKIDKLIRSISTDQVEIENIKKALQPILHFGSEELIEAFQQISLYTNAKLSLMKNLKSQELKKINQATYIVADKNDYLFPGEDVLKKAKKYMPNIAGTYLLETGSHMGIFNPLLDNTDCYNLLMTFLNRN